MTSQPPVIDAVAGSLSPDGQFAELQFVRKDGTIARVHFPMVGAPAISLAIDQALGSLFKKQKEMLGGNDPRTFFPLGAKRVVSIQGASAQGVPVLSFVLDTGLRLDFRLETEQIHGLIEWLEGLESLRDTPREGGN